jgi:hypothetical protein
VGTDTYDSGSDSGSREVKAGLGDSSLIIFGGKAAEPQQPHLP